MRSDNHKLDRHMMTRVCLMAALAGAATGCTQPAADWHNWFSQNKQTTVDERAEAARRAEEAKPEPPPTILPATYVAAGRMLESNGDIAGAIMQYQKALEADPREVQAYSRLGVAWQRLGKYPEAEQAFQKGIGLQPNAAFLHNNLGCCYMLQKRYDFAQGAFQKALAINPEFKRARMNLAMVMGRMGRMNESLTEFQRVLTPDSANYNVGVICMQQNRPEDAKRYFAQALAINPSCPGARENLDRIQQVSVTRLAPPAPEHRGPATFTLTADGLQQTMATSADDSAAIP